MPESFYLIFLTLGFFIGIISLSKTRRSFANTLFSILIFIISSELLRKYLLSEGYSTLPYLLSILSVSAQALWGPGIYLYTSALIGEKSNFSSKEFKYFHHFLTSFLILAVIKLSNINFADSQSDPSTYGLTSLVLIVVVRFGILLSGIVYTIRAIILLRKYQQQIKEFYSHIDKFKFLWIKHFLVSSLLFFSLVFVIPFFGIKTIFFSDYFLAIIILISALYVVRQPQIFEPISVLLPESVEDKSKDEFSKKGINQKESETIYKKLLLFMEQEKPYLDDSLKIGDLAEMMDIPAHHLSFAINQYSKLNFYRFINGYRIEEVKRKMSDEKNILTTAYECGFKSKSAFNRIFKEINGCTPSEYKRRISDLK